MILFESLTEEQIIERQGELGWNAISCYQPMSEEFLHQNADKINWYCLFQFNNDISKEIKNKFRWKYDNLYKQHSQAVYYDGTIVDGYEREGIFFFNNGDCDLVENLKFIEPPEPIRRSAQFNSSDYDDALKWAEHMMSTTSSGIESSYTIREYIRKAIAKKDVTAIEKIRDKYGK